MNKDVKSYHNYDTKQKESYKTIVKGWSDKKQEMLKQTNSSRIMRWSYSNGMYKYYNNPGKEITDQNPYVNIVNVDEFDLSIKNHPFPPDPPAFNNKNRPKFFEALMDEYVDESKWYKDQLHQSYERIIKESDPELKLPFNDKKLLTENQLKEAVKKFANDLGFVSVGVTKIDRRFVSVEVDDALIFDTIILLGYEMPHEVLKRYPKPKHDTAAYYGYAHCAANVHKVADFIRSQGYDCRARSWEGFIKYSVHAVNAGLGNFSTYGIVHTPQAGTRLKYTSIIIDGDLPLDLPKDFNIEEFCSRCRMCQKSCPAGAIPKEESSYRGTIKRTTDHIKCFDMMATKHECVQCIRVCPISMLGYDVVKKSLPLYYLNNLYAHDYKTDYLKGGL